MERECFTEEQNLFRESVREFFKREVGPHKDAWREAGIVSRDAFTKAGVEVAHLSDDDLAQWHALARETSHKLFAEDVEGGKALLDAALAVE